MSIAFELPNFPGKNQLTEPVSDGQPDGDRNYECVPTSIASGLQYLTGQPYDGDEIRDAVYGPNYVGGTAASAFVAYCAARGVDLTPFNGSQQALVNEIHQQLHAGHPVIITMPSQWGIAPPDPVHPVGWTHVGIMYGDGPGNPGELECMNPWIWPQLHIGDDAYWAARLCFGQVWIMSSKAGAIQMGVPQNWKDDGTTLSAPNGHHVTLGFRGFVIGAQPQWDATNVPLEEARGLAQTEHHAQLGAGTRQVFLRAILRWNNNTEGVKASDAGAEILACESEIAAAQAATTAMQSQRDALSAKLAAETTAAAQAAAAAQTAATAAASQIATLQQQLATALSHPAPAPDPVAEDAKEALTELKKVEGELP